MRETKENRPGLWKACRVVAAFVLAGTILSLLVLVFTFVLAFFVGGQMVTDGSGLMRLFLVANNIGERPIDALLFGYAGMPALSGTAVFFVYCCVLVSFLRKHKKKGDPFPGGLGYLIALCVLAAVSTVLPVALYYLFAGWVARSGYFTLQQPTIIPGCAVTVLTLLGTVFYARRAKPQNQEGETAV